MTLMLLKCRTLRVALRRTTSITTAMLLLFGLSRAPVVYGQEITIRPSSAVWHPKLTNGFFVAWAPNSPNLEVFDRNGSRVAILNILTNFPKDRAVSIYDAAVQPGRAIVVAACLVAREKEEVRGTLLYYDWHGALTQAVDLARSINLLDVDEDGNVWALFNGAGDGGPAKSPVIAIFRGGRIIKSFLNWSYFPHHDYEIDTGRKANGFPAFGITPERVWFWLPGCEVFSFDRDGGNLTRLRMKLPKPSGVLPAFAGYRDEPLVKAQRCAMTVDGRFVVQVQSRAVNVEPGLYILGKKGMSRYPIDRDGAQRNALLLGLDNSDLVFAQYDRSRSEYQIFWKHLE